MQSLNQNTQPYSQDNNEVWKDVPGYEGLYQASNMGIIKSLDREITQFCRKKYYIRKMKGQIIIPGLQNAGYEVVWLSKYGKIKAFTVHRLILLAFNKHSDVALDVNHIDGNKRNNRIINLEWCTRRENIKHAHKLPNRKSTGKSIKCIELNIVYSSTKEASKTTGINAGGIAHVLAGTSKTAGGYTWERA